MRDENKPKFADLLDWLEGRLPEEQARLLSEQLSVAGEETQYNLEWLRGFLQLSREVKLASPPAKVRDVLKDRFRTYAQDRKSPDLIQRLQATLAFDSSTGFATAGVRAAPSTGRQKQLVYKTRIAEIALNLQPRADDQRINLIGQVFPTGDISPDSFVIQLVQNSSDMELTTTDDLGEFFFEGLLADTYDIIILADQFEVVIPSIQLQF